MGHSSQVARLASLTGLNAAFLLDRQQELLEMLVGAKSLPEVLNAVARFSEAAMPGMLASVLVYDGTTRTLRKGGYGALPPAFQDAVDGLTPGPAAGSCGTAAFRRQRVISGHVATDPLWAPFAGFAAQYDIVSAWSSPIVDAEGELLGVFGMYRSHPSEPSHDDLLVVDHFTHLASLAIQRHRMDDERERRSRLDPQTHLPNREALRVYAEALRTDGKGDCSLAVIDLDHFKLHNDTLGQSAGDRLIRAAGERMAASLSGSWLFARLSSDQFVAVVPGVATDALRDITETVQELREEPLTVGPLTAVRLTASAGIVTWRAGDHVVELDDALFHALQALQAAKELGRSKCVAFGEDDRNRSDVQLKVTQELRSAILEGRDRLEPVLQPIVSLKDGTVTAFEVLARLRSESGAAISPATFIPIAESTGLIVELGQHIFASACALVARGVVPDGVNLNVNVSIRQLLAEDFVEQLTSTAKAHAVAPGRFVLEVTESQWLDETSPARAALLRLKERGFSLALDDFGAGYASLSLLQTLPFDQMKIDRTLISETHTRRGLALCRAAVAMAQAVGMRATAEGVETAHQLDAVRTLGIDTGQGFYWARPMAPKRAAEWLASSDVETAVAG